VINLRIFCDTENYSRFLLATPWIRQGWCYAADGRIVVRLAVTVLNLTCSADTANRPDAFRLFRKFPACVRQWPVFEHEALTCRVCAGSGKKLVQCKRCIGFPKIAVLKKTKILKVRPCPACDDEGRVPGRESCIFCQRGVIPSAPAGCIYGNEGRRRLKIGGRFFDTFYLAIIESQFQGLRYGNSRTNGMLRFTSHGGVQGILMPLG